MDGFYFKYVAGNDLHKIYAGIQIRINIHLPCRKDKNSGEALEVEIRISNELGEDVPSSRRAAEALGEGSGLYWGNMENMDFF